VLAATHRLIVKPNNVLILASLIHVISSRRKACLSLLKRPVITNILPSTTRLCQNLESLRPPCFRGDGPLSITAGVINLITTANVVTRHLLHLKDVLHSTKAAEELHFYTLLLSELSDLVLKTA
jgi:hypothetical protein